MAETIEMQPVGRVAGGRKQPLDDDWGGSESTIVLDSRFPEDALEGLEDLKPVIREFLPRQQVRQPAWAGELMAHYWREAPRSRT